MARACCEKIDRASPRSFFRRIRLQVRWAKAVCQHSRKQVPDLGSTFNQTVENSLHIKPTVMQRWDEEILSGDIKTCSESLVVYVGANAFEVQSEPD